jgi:hypothetical protein
MVLSATRVIVPVVAAAPCPASSGVSTSNPPRFSGAKIAMAATHIRNPPIQPTSARHRCSDPDSRSGSGNSVAPVVVKLETIST